MFKPRPNEKLYAYGPKSLNITAPQTCAFFQFSSSVSLEVLGKQLDWASLPIPSLYWPTSKGWNCVVLSTRHSALHTSLRHLFPFTIVAAPLHLINFPLCLIQAMICCLSARSLWRRRQQYPINYPPSLRIWAQGLTMSLLPL